MSSASADTALSAIVQALETDGLVAALRLINARTPHRFTGVYRYDGDMLRNVALVDVFDPSVTRGDDVAMGDAYCAIVGQRREPLFFADARNDPRFTHKPNSAVVCYCGVLLVDEAGAPFGTLCHFDVKPCDSAKNDAELLASVAPRILHAVRREGLDRAARATT